MDLFVLDKIILDKINSLNHIGGYRLLLYSIFVWGITESLVINWEKKHD